MQFGKLEVYTASSVFVHRLFLGVAGPQAEIGCRHLPFLYQCVSSTSAPVGVIDCGMTHQAQSCHIRTPVLIIELQQLGTLLDYLMVPLGIQSRHLVELATKRSCVS